MLLLRWKLNVFYYDRTHADITNCPRRPDKCEIFSEINRLWWIRSPGHHSLYKLTWTHIYECHPLSTNQNPLTFSQPLWFWSEKYFFNPSNKFYSFLFRWLVDLLLGMGHSNRCSQWVRSVKCQSVAWSCQWYHSCHIGQYKYYSSNGYTHGQVKRLETWSQDMLLISTCISMGMNVSICMRCLVFNDHLSFNITSILILHFYVDRFLSQLVKMCK